MKRQLWVVEALFAEDEDKRPAAWQTTVGVSLTKAGGRDVPVYTHSDGRRVESPKRIGVEVPCR